ncbi:hypothetical protein EVAR_82208_1 [Eumeta japonica]|uniref:Uncharacterized protein n=1 Tax=Eumeta variegata TaxID=151549 RepID=A0A4C1W6P4_EUMVA|nr:hypothetical protein EVAR_82208_1 [Eumeta japonica]
MSLDSGENAWAAQNVRCEILVNHYQQPTPTAFCTRVASLKKSFTPFPFGESVFITTRSRLVRQFSDSNSYVSPENASHADGIHEATEAFHAAVGASL